MSHTITCKLNKDARQHAGNAGTTFFVSLGEKNYNFKTKTNEWTNYEAALFAKDAQIGFYGDALKEGAIIEVTGTGLIMEMPSDPQYKPRLHIQDAKLGFIHGGSAQPQQAAPQQRAPQQQSPQQGGYAPAPQRQQQQSPQQGGYAPAPQRQQRQAPVPQQNVSPELDDGWDQDIPF